MANDFQKIDPEIFKILSRRLHKKLKIRVSKDEHSNLTLSQLQEDIAQALGYKNLHDVQQSWKVPTNSVLPPTTINKSINSQRRSQIDYKKYDVDDLMERELFLELFPVYQQLSEVASLGERKAFEAWCVENYVDLLQMQDKSTGARRSFNVLANIIAFHPELSDILIELGDKLTIDDIANWNLRHQNRVTNIFSSNENEGSIKKRLFFSLNEEEAFWGINSSRVSFVFKKEDEHLLDEVNNHLLSKGLSYALSDLYVKNPQSSKLAVFRVISNGMTINGNLVASFVQEMEEKYGTLDKIYDDLHLTYKMEYVSACAAWGDLNILLAAEKLFPDASREEVKDYNDHSMNLNNSYILGKFNRLNGAINSGSLPVFEHVIKDYSSACYEYALSKALVMGHDDLILWLHEKGVVLHENMARDSLLYSLHAKFSSPEISNEKKISVLKRAEPFISPEAPSLGTLYISSLPNDFLPENKKFIEYLIDHHQLDVNYLVDNENLFDRAPGSKKYVVGVVNMLLDLGVDPNRSRGGLVSIASSLLKDEDHCMPVIKKLVDKIGDRSIANNIMKAAKSLSHVKALSKMGLQVTIPAAMTWIKNVGMPGNGEDRPTTLAVSKMIGWSVENGLDVNGVDELGNTMLHGVSQRGDIALSIIDRLLSCGAHLDIKNKDGKTCVDLATDQTLSCLSNISRRKMKP